MERAKMRSIARSEIHRKSKRAVMIVLALNRPETFSFVSKLNIPRFLLTRYYLVFRIQIKT
jgi:hypothetical protein